MTTITASSTVGISLASPGYISPIVINPGVSISNTGDAIAASSGSWILQNNGTIAGTGISANGIDLAATGSVTNMASGSIVGSSAGILFGGDGTVVNYGSIDGQSGTSILYVGVGVDLRNGGAVTNHAGGTISGYGFGIYAYGNTGTVINAGFVAGENYSGVRLQAGGVVTNQSGGTISGGHLGVLANSATGTVINAGSIAGGIGLYNGGAVTNQAGGTISGAVYVYTGSYTATLLNNAGAYWQLTGTSTIGDGVTLTNAGTLTVLGASFTDNGSLVNSGLINIDPSSATLASIGGSGTIDVGSDSTLAITGSVAAGETIRFTGTNAVLNLYDPSEFAGSILNQGPTNHVNSLCFCAGTRILTPFGERLVEDLAAGDLVQTHRGEPRPIVWIGTGKVLATRGRRNEATPLVVRQGALADNVPHRDLHVTKGHALYLDGVLIPVEELVNHSTIQWDDRAQEVTIYHVELATHDVLIANGAPAESYRDDGNRWLFQNVNPGWQLPRQAPYAPVVNSGTVVDAAWRRLLQRAAPREPLLLIEEADLHLVVDGKRMEALERRADGTHVFRLAVKPRSVRLASRSAVPQEIAAARDPRRLGVAVRRIVLAEARSQQVVEAEDASLCDGFHAFEPDNGIRWTNGDATLPAGLFSAMRGAAMLMVELGGGTWYLAEKPVEPCRWPRTA